MSQVTYKPRVIGRASLHELVMYPSVLCVVSRRDDARELHRLMTAKEDGNDTLHLSALMCGEHRSKVIADIKARLKRNEPVRVISTQLVEAGVDVDFPVVYRALAGPGFDCAGGGALQPRRQARMGYGASSGFCAAEVCSARLVTASGANLDEPAVRKQK